MRRAERHTLKGNKLLLTDGECLNIYDLGVVSRIALFQQNWVGSARLLNDEYGRNKGTTRLKMDWKGEGGLRRFRPCARFYPCTDSRTEGVCKWRGRGVDKDPLSPSVREVKLASRRQHQAQRSDQSPTGAGLSTRLASVP